MKHALIPAILLLPLCTGTAAADDDAVSHGKKLHEEHCVRCHDSSVYTRDDRKITSEKALGVQVRRCRDNLGLTWFDEDIDAVIDYLNETWYGF